MSTACQHCNGTKNRKDLGVRCNMCPEPPPRSPPQGLPDWIETGVFRGGPYYNIKGRSRSLWANEWEPEDLEAVAAHMRSQRTLNPPQSDQSDKPTTGGEEL
jgi:hypothetical protein